MENLLKGDVYQEDSGLRLDLFLSGELKPKINELAKYMWRLEIRGNNKYKYVDEMRIKITFNNEDEQLYRIVETKMLDQGTNEEEESPEINVGTSGVGLTIPISKRDQYHIRQYIKEKSIECVIENINLDNDLKASVRGEVSIEFKSGSRNEKFKFRVKASLDFRRKFLGYIKTFSCPNPPKIDPDEVSSKCNEIIPRAPLFEFISSPEEGILSKGNIRIVSLKANIIPSISRILLIRNVTEQNSILKECGRKIGEDFLNELRNSLQRSPTIDDWAEYESSSGMGKFILHMSEKYIEVKNSFTALDLRSEDPVCHFLSGYLESIISAILNENIIITEDKCIAKGDEICRFSIQKIPASYKIISYKIEDS